MKAFLVAAVSVLLMLLASPPTTAKEEAYGAGGRIPAPPVEEAIRLVKAVHEKESQLKPFFVDEAVFQREAGRSFWRIGVRDEKHETGHLIYTVDKDGAVKVDSVVKDG